MSEFSPPGVPEGTALVGQGALTSEAVEAVLADFRAWLQQASLPPAPTNGEPAAEAVDLHTLLAQFVALRHEVNLQTRAVRTQQEHNIEALRHLSEALEALRASRDAAAQARAGDQDEAVRPLLKTLIDLYDALALAGREVQRVEQSLLPSLAEVVAPLPECEPPGVPVPAPRSGWGIWLGRGRTEQPELIARRLQQAERAREVAEVRRERQARAEQAAARVGQVLTSVVTGYTMSVQRVERALQQYGLEPIPTVGEPFDPEVMEAVEVVTDPGRRATEVIEEVRRGYRWRGRVFRYAQVRVARP